MNPDTALLLLVIAVGAVVSPSLGRWLGVPAAVVEILFGVGVGATGLSGGVGEPFVRFLADLGFALFLFLAGMEVDARSLRRGGVAATLGPVVASGVSFALALVFCMLMGWSPWVALALGATSVPLLLAVVREAGLAAAPMGRSMLTLAAVGEVVTVAMVAFAEVLQDAAGLGHAAVGVLRLVGLLALVVLGTRLIAVLRWWFPERARRLVGAGDAAETGVRMGFGLAFAMIAAAALAGVEPLLGAFVGGLMVSFAFEEKRAIEEKFGAMAYGFFVPVFFVDVGLRLDVDPAAFGERFPRVALICVVMLAVKLVPSLGWLVVGRTPRQVLASALLLAAPLTLVIAIADLAGRLGAIDEATEGVLVLAGMLASLLYPSIARGLLARGR